jgi:hypothetical protein
MVATKQSADRPVAPNKLNQLLGVGRSSNPLIIVLRCCGGVNLLAERNRNDK